MVAISRVGERDYELRVFKQATGEYGSLFPYAVNMIGHQGKQYGYISNADFARVIGVSKIGKVRASLVI